MNPKNTITISVTVIAIAVLAISCFCILKILDMPIRLTEKATKIVKSGLKEGKNTLKGAARLLADINQQKITINYTSTATKTYGTSRLQVATIKQTELMQRKESSKFYGLPLPDNAVSAEAPITYTYYVDLGANWKFGSDGKQLNIIAPAIQFNMPAVDASEIKYKVDQGSIWRNNDNSIERLKGTITMQSIVRAKDNINIIRETARREIEKTIRNWVFATYAAAYNLNDDHLPVNVVFADELTSAGGTGQLNKTLN